MKVKKAILIFLPLALAGAAVYYFVTADKSTVEYTTVKVERGNVVQTVSEVGTVKSANKIDLNFLNTGRVQKINVKVGDFVKANQVLAELDYDSLIINKKELEANLDVSISGYNKLLAGASYEEIAIARAGEQQAKAAYEAAQNELIKIKGAVIESQKQAQKTLSDLEEKTSSDVTTYEQSITAAETSLANAMSTYGRVINNYKQNALSVSNDKLALAKTTLDIIDRTINDEDGKDLISVKNLVYLENTKKQYKDSLSLLSNAESVLAVTRMNNNNENYTLLLSDTKATLNMVFNTLQNCFSALENSITSSDFSLTDLNTLKSGISTEKNSTAAAITSVQSIDQNLNDAILNYNTNVRAAEDSLQNAKVAYENAIKNARNALATAQVSGEQQIAVAQSRTRAASEAYLVAKAQLNKVSAPADKNDLILAQAKIRQAQATLDSINKKIEDSIIKAPIDGTLTEINYEIGEQLKAGVPVISMLGVNNFEIEVLISEADIAKIKKDQDCTITLDAFGEETEFLGKIGFIDPAETEVQDVIYYKITIYFDPGKETVKPGMTANIIVTTAKKENVLFVPSRAILNKGQQEKYVRVLVNGAPEEKKVSLGLSGDGGFTEVLSGVLESDLVITYVKEAK